MDLIITKVKGLTEIEMKNLAELVRVFNYYRNKNADKARYYEGHIPLSEVNLGIALPKTMRELEIGCEWGRKTVDVLASRSMFDGFVGVDGKENEELRKIAEDNNLFTEYDKSTKDELKFGCNFATLSADAKIGCKIRFHSPRTASALWDGARGRIACGMAIIDTAKSEKDELSWKPSLINYYTDDAVIVLTKTQNGWTAKRHEHRLGRPLMEPLIWSSTSDKPFGSSRLKEPIRRLIQGYVRTVANATIGLEFATSPQKYLMGVTEDMYDAVVSDKFKQYVGSIIVATENPETGDKPSFGQLPQGTIEPHVAMLRLLATQFSAATGLTVTDTGVINDANPTSSDAILAQSQTLVLMAEQLNRGNADALKTIALMAQAIKKNVTLEELTDDERNVIAHFKNPAMPSVSQTADAATKIASVRPEFASTDTFLEMLGFGQADIRRIKAQETRVRGQNVLLEVEE